MPHKDPEKRKKASQESMRRRREKLRSPSSPVDKIVDNFKDRREVEEKPQDTPGETMNGVSSAPGNLSQAAVTDSPPYIDVEKAHLIDFVPDFHTQLIVNRWHSYPDEEGFPCCKAPGRCCLPLRHAPPRAAVTSCVFLLKLCPYYKEPNENSLCLV